MEATPNKVNPPSSSTMQKVKMHCRSFLLYFCLLPFSCRQLQSEEFYCFGGCYSYRLDSCVRRSNVRLHCNHKAAAKRRSVIHLTRRRREKFTPVHTAHNSHNAESFSTRALDILQEICGGTTKPIKSTILMCCFQNYPVYTVRLSTADHWMR